MPFNCLAKTVRHLAEMFSRCLKDSFFANLNSVLQKRCLHFQKDINKLLRQLTEMFFQISQIQLSCKSSQYLSKPLFRQLRQTSANWLGCMHLQVQITTIFS